MIITNNDIYAVNEASTTETQMVSLTGRDRNNQIKSYVPSDRSMAFIGCPRCGKTTQIVKIVNQLQANPEGVTVVLDVKKEYIERCFRPGDIVLSTFDIPEIPSESQPKWSIMYEALGEHPEVELKDIATSLFKDAIEHSENKMFPEAAMLVFYAQLVYAYRMSNVLMPSNKELIKRIESMTDKEIMQSIKQYEDLFPVTNLLAEKVNITSYGIRAEIMTVLLNVFPMNTNFCSENSTFSIRQFIKNGHGHKLFLVFDNATRKTSENIVRLLIDLSMKQALSGKPLHSDDKRRCYFVLDEYGYIPPLEYLDLVKDVGPGLGLRVISGFQTISQLKKLYNGREEGAMNDAAGYGDVVVFKPHDDATRDYVVSRGGTEIKEITTIDVMCNTHIESKEMPVVPPSVLNKLKCGEAVILPDVGRPFWFHFDK